MDSWHLKLLKRQRCYYHLEQLRGMLWHSVWEKRKKKDMKVKLRLLAIKLCWDHFSKTSICDKHHTGILAFREKQEERDLTLLWLMIFSGFCFWFFSIEKLLSSSWIVSCNKHNKKIVEMSKEWMNENHLVTELPEKSLVSAILEKLYGLKHSILHWKE